MGDSLLETFSSRYYAQYGKPWEKWKTIKKRYNAELAEKNSTMQADKIFKLTWLSLFRSWLKYYCCLSCCTFEIFLLIFQIIIAKCKLCINSHRKSKWRNQRKLKKKLKMVIQLWWYYRSQEISTYCLEWEQNWKRNRWNFSKENQHSRCKKNNPWNKMKNSWEFSMMSSTKKCPLQN